MLQFSHSISINERNDGIVSSAHLSSGSIVSADETGQRAGPLINGCAVCLTLTRAAHVYLARTACIYTANCRQHQDIWWTSLQTFSSTTELRIRRNIINNTFLRQKAETAANVYRQQLLGMADRDVSIPRSAKNKRHVATLWSHKPPNRYRNTARSSQHIHKSFCHVTYYGRPV